MDTVTVSHTNVAAKAVALEEFAVGVLNGVDHDNGATGSDAAPTVSLAALPSRTYLFLGECGREYDSAVDAPTKDADYTDYISAVIGTTGGGATSNVSSIGGYRIVAATGDTYNPTWVNVIDWADILGALHETGSHRRTPAMFCSSDVFGVV